jgi:small-conductance mechanosensitive channel
MITRIRIFIATLLLLALTGVASGFESVPADPRQGSNSKANNTASAEPATIEFWNRPIVVLRSNVAGGGPQDRARRAEQRIKELPLGARSTDIELTPITAENDQGYGFTYQGRVLFFLANNDLDQESNETMAAAVKHALIALDQALQAREDEQKWPIIRSGILHTVVGLALLIVFCCLVLWAHRHIYRYLRSKEYSFPVKLRLFGIDLLPHIANMIYALLHAVGWFLTLSGTYIWLTHSLGSFPYTQPWGRRLGGFVVGFMENLGLSAIHAVPGIFACIIIFLIARWIVRLGRAIFAQVASGSIRLSWMDADVARATERIFAAVVWIFAVVVAYPYIPGSSTDAFKGISVFFGLVISLGSTGIINQIMSGMFVVYSKALKTGEWVLVNETEGEVEEVGLLSVKIRTVELQEVTIPNSVIVATSTKNFSRLGQTEGMAASVTVTIGYDAPWRQVHALLLLGAERTSNIREKPEPYVLQRALSDFYVEYTLIVRLGDEHRRIETLSELHGHVQDAFNEYGVQIMSPHFVLQPKNNIVVPREKWHEAPASPENGSGSIIAAQENHFEAGI